jgi:hypothetical protein
MSQPRRPGTAFYCVTGSDFFHGAVALLNSLRLAGHAEPMVVLDCGMEPRQRDLLAPHAEILPAPDGPAPSMLKLVAPLVRPAEAIALLDADVIVTRPLTDLIGRAAEGRLVGFENEKQRFFAEWAELLETGPVRRGPYMTSSTLFIGGDLAAELLPIVRDKQAEVDVGATWLGEGGEGHPFFYADQDVLNGVVLSRLGPEQVVALDSRLSAIPPFEGLRLEDRGSLSCRYVDGTRPYLLHHYFRKPWLVRMRSNVYSRLLTRLLLGPDVELRLDPSELPVRLRAGLAGTVGRLATDVLFGIPASMRRRIRSSPRRIRAWPEAGRHPNGTETT